MKSCPLHVVPSIPPVAFFSFPWSLFILIHRDRNVLITRPRNNAMAINDSNWIYSSLKIYFRNSIKNVSAIVLQIAWKIETNNVVRLFSQLFLDLHDIQKKFSFTFFFYLYINLGFRRCHHQRLPGLPFCNSWRPATYVFWQDTHGPFTGLWLIYVFCSSSSIYTFRPSEWLKKLHRKAIGNHL